MGPFFSCFNLTISYHLGSKNTKPDALSRLVEGDCPKEAETIIPETHVLGCAAWGIEEQVKEAPPNKLFVMPDLQGPMITSSFLLHERFWGPGMRNDVNVYVAACTVCEQNKSKNIPSAGLFWPLSVPQRPWAEISLDFVTGLPPSEGNIVMMVRFIPLTKITLPRRRQSWSHTF